MGYLGVLVLAAFVFFEAIKLVTYRLRLSCHHLVSAPSALRAYGTSTLSILRSKQDSAAPVRCCAKMV